jgi:hypothetical protein
LNEKVTLEAKAHMPFCPLHKTVLNEKTTLEIWGDKPWAYRIMPFPTLEMTVLDEKAKPE